MKSKFKVPLILLAAAVVFGSLGTAALAAPVVNACVNNSTRAVRIPVSTASCIYNETAMVFGAKGDKGDTGDQGGQGPQGDTGDKGAKGATGDPATTPTIYRVTVGPDSDAKQQQRVASCADFNDEILGGGTTTVTDDEEIQSSYPIQGNGSTTKDGFVGRNFEEEDTQVSAICLTVP